MRSTLSQRYSSAFIEAFGTSGCQSFLQKQEMIRALFNDNTFLELINNPFVSYTKKYDVLCDVLKFEDEKVKRALMLLAKAERLEFLPEILDDISTSVSLENKAYKALVYCNAKMSKEMLGKLTKMLSEKLDLTVEVQERLWDKDGIKCVIEELDLEVSFSKEIFISGLQKYILDTFRKGV